MRRTLFLFCVGMSVLDPAYGSDFVSDSSSLRRQIGILGSLVYSQGVGWWSWSRIRVEVALPLVLFYYRYQSTLISGLVITNIGFSKTSHRTRALSCRMGGASRTSRIGRMDRTGGALYIGHRCADDRCLWSEHPQGVLPDPAGA